MEILTKLSFFVIVVIKVYVVTGIDYSDLQMECSFIPHEIKSLIPVNSDFLDSAFFNCDVSMKKDECIDKTLHKPTLQNSCEVQLAILTNNYKKLSDESNSKLNLLQADLRDAITAVYQGLPDASIIHEESVDAIKLQMAELKTVIMKRTNQRPQTDSEETLKVYQDSIKEYKLEVSTLKSDLAKANQKLLDHSKTTVESLQRTLNEYKLELSRLKSDLELANKKSLDNSNAIAESVRTSLSGYNLEMNSIKLDLIKNNENIHSSVETVEEFLDDESTLMNERIEKLFGTVRTEVELLKQSLSQTMLKNNQKLQTEFNQKFTALNTELTQSIVNNVRSSISTSSPDLSNAIQLDKKYCGYINNFVVWKYFSISKC